MHYLIQIPKADIEAACVESFDGVRWVKQWHPQGGDKYIGHFPSGQAVISGPMLLGNPNKTWFEIQCTDPAILDEIAPAERSTMKAQMRGNGLLRAWYRVSGRELIRNSQGRPVGVMPDFVICGTNPAASFLLDEDADDAQELLDLE